MTSAQGCVRAQPGIFARFGSLFRTNTEPGTKNGGRSNHANTSDRSLLFYLDAVYKDLRAVVVGNIAEQCAIEMNNPATVA